MAHHVKVSPVRLREHSDQLGCDTSRVVGYRTRCSCGWRGKVRRTVRESLVEVRGHARYDRLSV